MFRFYKRISLYQSYLVDFPQAYIMKCFNVVQFRAVNQISINAIPYRNDVRVTYNGGPGNKIILKNGKNLLRIDVTSPSGRTIQYMVTLNK